MYKYIVIAATLCLISWENCQTIKKNHISQCKIAKYLGISPSTKHNIVKSFRESREISMNEKPGNLCWMSVTFERFRRHCMRNHHATGLKIATWTLEHFGKPLPLNTVCHCIKKCNLNLCSTRRKLYINSMQRIAAKWSSLSPSSSQMIQNTVGICAEVRWIHVSTYFGETGQ